MKQILIYGLLLLAVAGPRMTCGQVGSGWERTDLFGNPNSLNVSSQYRNFLVHNGTITVSASGSVIGYWAKYTLQGQLLWQRSFGNVTGGWVGFPWRDGLFAYGAVGASNRVGYTGLYTWLNGKGDTVRIRKSPAVRVDQLATCAATRDGRYYVGGLGDNSGTGQPQVNNHFSLACLDTAGNLRWQRNYLNPVIRIGAQFPATTAYMYLRKILEAPRRGWLLAGDGQRDSANYQLYFIEVDSAGQPRRARWAEPFGRTADVKINNLGGAVRLRDGSGYVVSGQAKIDSLGRTRVNGFVAKVDTALRVVWRTLIEVPPPTGVPGSALQTSRIMGGVQEAADGSLRVLTYAAVPRPAANEFDVLHLSAQGRPTRRDTYCSQVCATVDPQSWQLLPGDSTIVVSGRGQQRDASGRLLAQPAWLAYFERPCRTQLNPVVSATRTGAVPAGVVALYPQPAVAGSMVRLAPARPARGPAQVLLLDALGRAVAQAPATAADNEWQWRLPAALAPGLYAVRVLADGHAVATARLVVQGP